MSGWKCQTGVTGAKCVGCPATPTGDEKLERPELWFSDTEESLLQIYHNN
jgi:hypothetical protein